MLLNFLTDGSGQNVMNNLSIPKVTTNQMVTHVNGIVGQLYKVADSTALNIAMFFLIVAIIALMAVAVFAKKHVGKAVISIVVILLGVILIKFAPYIVGWVSGMANF